MKTPAIRKLWTSALTPNTTTDPTHKETTRHQTHARICITMCLVWMSGIRDSGLCLLSMISLYPFSTSKNKNFMMTCLFFAKVLANFSTESVASIRPQSESRFVKKGLRPLQQNSKRGTGQLQTHYHTLVTGAFIERAFCVLLIIMRTSATYSWARS